MTPAEELRAAVTKLTCQHEHPVQPPHGSLERPGPCEHCGTPWETREPVPDWLRRSLADALDKMLEALDEGAPCPPSVLRLARAITGGTP